MLLILNFTFNIDFKKKLIPYLHRMKIVPFIQLKSDRKVTGK